VSGPANGAVARLGERHDLAVRLTPDEVAELTELALDVHGPVASEETQLVSLASLLQMLEPHELSIDALDRAIEAVMRGRRQRLHNVIARKAHELERMLFGLLPRFDGEFHARPRVRIAGSAVVRGGGRPMVEYDVRAESARLDIRVLYVPRADRLESLFTLSVREARRATIWDRLEGRSGALPRSVSVRSRWFAGTTSDDLIRWTLMRVSSGNPLGAASAVAVERLRDTILVELDDAVRFVDRLRFDPE